MLSAGQENERSLARLLGLEEDRAAEKLAARVAITPGPGAVQFAEHLSYLLSFTLTLASPGEPVDVEVTIGAAPERSARVSIAVTTDGERMSLLRGSALPTNWVELPGLTSKICACFAAGFVIANAVEAPAAERHADGFHFDFSSLGLGSKLWAEPLELKGAVLVGAGGVANGFMWALRELPVSGSLIIADPKAVRPGNLNRCFYFTVDDIDEPKARVLAQRSSIEGLITEGYVGTFQKLVAERGPVALAITTPDSRRARRLVQDALPFTVVDASTTDISAVVVHSHQQPTAGACLGCIYPYVAEEGNRERDIASGLGVTVEDVRAGLVTDEVAAKILEAHPDLAGRKLVGMAFDSLYKERCAEDSLITAAGEQALAPFAYISALAGALQVVELALRLRDPNAPSSYLNVDPWSPPHRFIRRAKERLKECHFCGRPIAAALLKEMWAVKSL
jgi:molybdopterin/thiamine biosynthesis adenylyltransferase